MSKVNPCRHQVLAENGVAQVQRCVECGCVSLHLGAFTVRLDDASLEALARVTGDAAEALQDSRMAQLQNVPYRGLA